MSATTPGTYSVPVSGPSAALAFLRALALKARSTATTLWSKATVTIATATRLPATVAAGVQAVLSTRAGYHAATSTLRAVTRLTWNGVRGGARLLSRVAGIGGRTATTLVGYVSAPGADTMVRLCDTIADRVTHAARRVDDTVIGAGDVAYELLHTTLVRTVVTTTATTASAMATIHWLTQGMAAARLVRTMPFLMDAVIVVTNPMRTLALIAVATLAAMAFALARLLQTTRRGSDPTTETGGTGDAHQPAEEAAPDRSQAGLPINWQQIAANLRIEVCNDGSIVAHGIPDDVPRAQGEAIARIATDAAVKQFIRTKSVRPYPSRDDKRLFTKVAKEALRAEGRRQAGTDRQAA